MSEKVVTKQECKAEVVSLINMYNILAPLFADRFVGPGFAHASLVFRASDR